MGNGAQKFEAVALFLQGICVRRAGAQKSNVCGPKLPRLPFGWARYQVARHLDAGAGGQLWQQLGHRRMAGVHHHLQGGDTGAVAEGEKDDALAAAHAAQPAAQATGRSLACGQELGDGRRQKGGGGDELQI